MLNNIDFSIYKNIDLITFQSILDESLTTSYKILWFKGIIEELSKNKREIFFDEIVINMIIFSWCPILKYKLSFGQADQLHSILLTICSDLNLNSDTKKIDLEKTLYANQKYLKKHVKFLSKYVPYRLLSPFYKDSLSGTDYAKQKQIATLNSIDKNSLYIVDSNTSKINISNDEWFVFLYSNQKILKEWCDYKYIHFLQRRNVSVPSIPFKLNFITKRDLLNQTKLWKDYIKSNTIYDIYTNEKLTIDNLSIDHFIPWSFVLHDENWNLIPTSKNINSSKNDHLPNLDVYLDSFCELQYNLLIFMLNEKKYKFILESYISIDINIFNTLIDKNTFINKLKNTLIPLHQIAFNQGFSIWNNTNLTPKLIDNANFSIIK